MLKKSSTSFPKIASWRQIGKKRVPDSFFRGFSHPGCFTPEGFITNEGFKFDLPVESPRSDSFEEASINWKDDEHALRILCLQRSKKNDIQFKYGYSELKLSDVTLQLRPFLSYFDYERKPLINNPYHGNLLIDRTVSGQTKKMMRDALATVASMNYHKHPKYPDIR